MLNKNLRINLPDDVLQAVDGVNEAKTDAQGTTHVSLKARLDSIVAGGGGSNVSTFTDLTDTPADLTGHANKQVTVKSDESGLEFTPVPTVSPSTDATTIHGKTVPNPTVSDDGKVLKYNNTSGAYEWSVDVVGGGGGGYDDTALSNRVTTAEGELGIPASAQDVIVNFPYASNVSYVNKGFYGYKIKLLNDATFQSVKYELNNNNLLYNITIWDVSTQGEVYQHTHQSPPSGDNSHTFSSPVTLLKDREYLIGFHVDANAVNEYMVNTITSQDADVQIISGWSYETNNKDLYPITNANASNYYGNVTLIRTPPTLKERVTYIENGSTKVNAGKIGGIAVDVSTVVDGYVLKYDTASGKIKLSPM